MKNNNSCNGHRIGAVCERSQTVTRSGHYVKRDTQTGRFTDVNADKPPFKGVQREKCEVAVLDLQIDFVLIDPRGHTSIGFADAGTRSVGYTDWTSI